MPTPDDLIALEDSWLGTVEDPSGSNETWIGRQFGWNGVAWCAETQSLATSIVFGRRILWTASVAAAITAAQNGDNGLGWIGRQADIEPGMLVTYDFGSPRGNPAHFHIAMVRAVADDQGTFQTDGGNERDAMRQQWRDRTYVQGFITLPYDQPAPTPASPPTPAPPLEEQVKAWIMRGHDRPEVFVVSEDLSHCGHVPAAKLGMTGYLLSQANALLAPPKTATIEVQDGVQTWVLAQGDMDAVRAICAVG